MRIATSNKKIFFTLAITYTIVNIPLLLNFNGIYWDDWTLVNHTYSTIFQQFSQVAGAAGIVTGTLHWFMINELGVYSYRLLTVALLLMSGWFLFNILCSVPLFTKTDSFFISILFLLSPLFGSRVALINFPYTLFNFVFFFGFFLVRHYKESPRIHLRIAILITFFLSFLVNSNLPFFSLVLLYLFYEQHNKRLPTSTNIVRFAKTNLDFIFLPILFWLTKTFLFNPSGLYLGYNEIGLSQALNFHSYYATIKGGLLEPIIHSMFMAPIAILLITSYAILSRLLFEAPRLQPQIDYDAHPETANRNTTLLIFGAAAFLVGAFPYIAVNKIPDSYSVDSRFQLLLPLGFSFINYYIIKCIVKQKYQAPTILFLLICFSGFHLKDQIKWNIEWFYSSAIINNLRSTSEIKTNSTFLVDYSEIHHARRIFRFYSLNGMAKMAFNLPAKTFSTNTKEINDQKLIYCSNASYNCSSWSYEPPIYLRISEARNNGFNKGKVQYIKTFLIIKHAEIFNKQKYEELTKSLIKFEVSQQKLS